MKIVTIIGARPQFIKAAVVSKEIQKYPEVEEVIVHTGQHFDENMSDVFFKQMSIPRPKYNLNVNSLSHGAMTGRMLEEIEKIILMEQPNWVLVYGDTNSTLAGALAAKKIRVKVAHIEAGLRSYNMSMPEEINRILTDRISDLLFCPTEVAIGNLKREGFDLLGNKMIKSGDVMQDAALFFSSFSRNPSFDVPQKFILATVHRAENTDDLSRLNSIIDSFNELSIVQPIILPLHPRTTQIINKNESIKLNSGIKVVEPQGYFQMLYLLKSCSLVVTDSGGLQKEAYFFRKPCVTIREETEWVELVEHGVNIVVGADKEKIKDALMTFSNQKLNFDIDLYGNGLAAGKIVKYLCQDNQV